MSDTETKDIIAASDAFTLVDILRAMGEEVPDGGIGTWKNVIGGAKHYWAAAANAAIKGIIHKVDERPTRLMNKGKQVKARFYTLELTSPCIGHTSDGEEVNLPTGELITVLERDILRDLEKSMGKEVVIVCDGKGKTRGGNDLWNFRVWEKGGPVSVSAG